MYKVLVQDIIVLTATVDGKELEGVELKASIFGQGSGIRILLEQDPTSEVIVKKPDLIISYKYKLENRGV